MPAATSTESAEWTRRGEGRWTDRSATDATISTSPSPAAVIGEGSGGVADATENSPKPSAPPAENGKGGVFVRPMTGMNDDARRTAGSQCSLRTECSRRTSVGKRARRPRRQAHGRECNGQQVIAAAHRPKQQTARRIITDTQAATADTERMTFVTSWLSL